MANQWTPTVCSMETNIIALQGNRECFKKSKIDIYTHELQASLKPFSIAGMKFEGIACPIIMLSNSNLPSEPDGRGSMYLHIVACQFSHHNSKWIQHIYLNKRLQAYIACEQVFACPLNTKIQT